MDRATCTALQHQARRLARNAADAEDLVQDTLVAALQAGRHDLPWLIGVLQRQAAMRARSQTRRRRRELAVADGDEGSTGVPAPSPAADAVLARLTPASRRLAVLALHGLSGEEIRWLLGLSPAAFRQRLRAIRTRLGMSPPELRAEALALAEVRDPARTVDLQFGLVRRALKVALRGAAGVATHDADGHLVVVRGRAHVPAPGGNESTGPTQEDFPC